MAYPMKKWIVLGSYGVRSYVIGSFEEKQEAVDCMNEKLDAEKKKPWRRGPGLLITIAETFGRYAE